MLEMLFLLLPVAAAYGWYMGRRSAQQDKQQDANRLSREYVAGVNFLLSNQQDKAVDLFLEMLKEDSSTVEAHLTLGNLFRSRGEVDRAIRIHQALMESASLTFEQRLLAVQQLGRDYMAAGLYDRAEDMFNQLVEEQDFRLGALQQLLIIHQATSDWHNAIEVAEKLVKMGKDNQRLEIAHFYCELALQAMGSDDLDKAMGLLKKRQRRINNVPEFLLCVAVCISLKVSMPKALKRWSEYWSKIKKSSVKHYRCSVNATNTCNSPRLGLISLNVVWKIIPVRRLN